VAGDPRLGADYGSFCAAWEDGICHPTADLPNPDGHHSCGTLSTCDGLWSSYNYNADHAWCCQAWCYVNASTCDAAAHGIDVARSWATTAEIYYSYGACSDSQYAAYTDDTCPYRSTMPGCECTGDNAALGAVELAKHGTNYGKWCAAWEDGKCTPGATAASLDGTHTCDGTDAASCEAHWPTYDFTQDQSWCCDSWCYVNETTCTPALQAKYGITIADSWTGADLKYSYGACSDPFSAPQAHEAVAYNPQTFSQVQRRAHRTRSCVWLRARLRAVQLVTHTVCGSTRKTRARTRQCPPGTVSWCRHAAPAALVALAVTDGLGNCGCDVQQPVGMRVPWARCRPRPLCRCHVQ
jgi:hypothetical protein